MQGNHIEEINNGCLKIDLLQDDGCLEMVSDLETSTVSYKSSIKVEGSKECYASRWHLKYARKAISSSFSQWWWGWGPKRREKTSSSLIGLYWDLTTRLSKFHCNGVDVQGIPNLNITWYEVITILHRHSIGIYLK